MHPCILDTNYGHHFMDGYLLLILHYITLFNLVIYTCLCTIWCTILSKLCITQCDAASNDVRYFLDIQILHLKATTNTIYLSEKKVSTYFTIQVKYDYTIIFLNSTTVKLCTLTEDAHAKDDSTLCKDERTFFFFVLLFTS